MPESMADIKLYSQQDVIHVVYDTLSSRIKTVEKKQEHDRVNFTQSVIGLNAEISNVKSEIDQIKPTIETIDTKIDKLIETSLDNKVKVRLFFTLGAIIFTPLVGFAFKLLYDFIQSLNKLMV